MSKSPPKVRKQNQVNHNAEQETRAKQIAARTKAAKRPFQQWIKTCCDIQQVHEHKRVRISTLFQSYASFCVENNHDRLMSLRSKVQGLKFTANLLTRIGKKLRRRSRRVELTKDQTEVLCFPYIQLKTTK